MEPAIAAVATGPGRSAIGIIRLSGAGALAAVEAVFRPAGGGTLTGRPPRHMVCGTLVDREGAVIDHPLATWSPAPHSYTGEDTAELHCHGSPTVLALTLEALFAQGVRQAKPGEFTQRAFLNGKLDLLEAEAVADLVDAETPAAARSAADRLTGALSRRVSAVYDGLVGLLAHFHAALDYPDEDIDPFSPGELERALSAAAEELGALLASYDRGRILREGVPTAIVGPPNAGKSSLLNALLGYERAIVTDLPGTTRDTVEERCVLGGVLLRLIDTAGLRETADPVERLGVERSRRAMEEAGLILAVSDRSQPTAQEELDLLKTAMSLAPTIWVQNKTDLPPAPTPVVDFKLPPTVTGSVKRSPERMVYALGEAVAALFPQGAQTAGDVLSNARQAQGARRALEAVERAREAQGAGVTPDFLLSDVEEALEALGELTGANLREDVVAQIFSRFCVGK